MKNPFRFSVLPYLTMGAGGLGLRLRLWLFSATDEKGLLPHFHIADPLLYILTALTLGSIFLACRQRCTSPVPRQRLRLWDALGHVLGGLGLLLCAVFSLFDPAAAGLAVLVGVLLGGSILILTGVLTALGKAAPYWIFALLTAALMLYTIAQCRVWGGEPQLQVYFFPLMASVFAILTSYHRTLLAAGQRKARLLAFFSQSCLFFCFLSLNTRQWPLYLGLLCWACAQLIPCYKKKEA